MIKILKDQLTKQGAVTSQSGAGGITSPVPPREVVQEAPAVPRSTAAPPAGSSDTSRPATQETTESSLPEATAGQQPDNHPAQVDECVENVQCPGNCEHIGCHIIKCEECSFKTDSERRLESHIKESHRIICFTCKDAIRTFSDMIEHRRLNHPSTKKCSNFPNCERGDLCLYIHEGDTGDVTQENQTQGINIPITCRICLSEFHDKNKMMIHRKSEHLIRVGMCKFFQAGLTCMKGPDHCWYRHNMMTTQMSTSRNNTTAPKFNVENFPFGPTPHGAVVGHSQMQLQIIQQTLQAQQQQMSLMMTEIMRMRQ